MYIKRNWTTVYLKKIWTTDYLQIKVWTTVLLKKVWTTADLKIKVRITLLIKIQVEPIFIPTVGFQYLNNLSKGFTNFRGLKVFI